MKTTIKISLFFILLLILGYTGFNFTKISGKEQSETIENNGSLVQEVSPTQEAIAITATPTFTPIPSSPTAVPTPLMKPTLFVKPDGSDSNSGRSIESPFKTIQKAVDLAAPGDSIELLPGTYFQDVVTKRDGLPNKPITITGSKSAIVQGEKNPRIFEINHSYVVLNGFIIDGHHKSSEEKSSYRDKLIYVISTVPKTGVTNVKILNMDIKNAGGECIRFRYFSQYNEVAYSQIIHCGAFDFKFDTGGKNGEGVYIGTAPEQRGDGRNPTKDVDQSNNNWIHHNTFNTQGNECVDIKEGSSLNMIEYNSCTGQKDSKSGGMDTRGDNNSFRYNNIYDNTGSGVRVGGDKKKDGTNNHIYSNTIINNKSGGIKFQRTPQGKVCGNKMEGNEEGDAVGSYGKQFDPGAPC